MDISRAVQHALGPGPTRVLETLEGNINRVFKIRARGRLYALRVRVREDIYRYEPGLVKEEVVAACVSAPWLPRLVAADASRRLLPHPYCLYEWAAGGNLWETPEPALYEAAGRLLRGLHAARVPPAAARRLAPGGGAWAERFRLAWSKELRELDRSGTSCRLGRLRLAGVAPPRLCLVHNDFSGANILVGGGAVTGVIDWDNALHEAPELDLVKMKHWTARGSDGVLAHSPGLWKAFIKGYETDGPGGHDERRFELYERLWLMRVLNFERARGTPMPGYPAAAVYQAKLAELVV